jgi:hypothetical protein
MDLAAAAGARATLMSRLCAGEQLMDEDRCDSVRRDQRLRERRERADASVIGVSDTQYMHVKQN